MLARGRARADQGMTETIRAGIWRDGTDPETGDAVRVLVTEHYSGPAQVTYPSTTVSITDATAQRVASQAPVIKVPVTAAILPEGDTVDVEDSSADIKLIGRRYTIEGAPQGGQTTSHRYPAKELT